MCGIALLFSPTVVDEERKERMQHCLNVMRHRGPDDEGMWKDRDITIGHRRLSIIDIAASRQPMVDPTGRYVLTYNGEIYNYKELRAGLESRWQFETQGDTEVLLSGLIIHGLAFLEKMEGMWAFALWDNLEKHLLICRDRMGKKPLYYQQILDSFICASELPALACLKSWSWEEDLDSSADYLRYGFYLPGTTAYKSVNEVLPGHYLSWSFGGKSKQQTYWMLSLDGYTGNRKEAVRDLKQYTIEAVKKRLVADVEVGAFLSGGVDSSLIVSIMAKRLGVCPKTFTIAFKERSYDERKYAEQVARYCCTNHYIEELPNWDNQKLTNLILKNVGQPFADYSLLPTSRVSEIASRYVKVALSGDGGDELFCGYQRYQARSILRWYTRLPKPLRGCIGRMIRALPEPMAHHSRSLLKKAHLFQDILDQLDCETPYVAPLLYSKEMFKSLAPNLAKRGHQLQIPQEYDVDEIYRMMTADALIYLPQDILLKVDRASMANSLEVRAPFLDSKVVELAFSLPRTWHKKGMKGKMMLFEAFQGDIPEIIWRRRKQGFSVPIHDWFKKDLGKELEELIYHNVIIEEKMVMRLLFEHRQGIRDHSYRLWSVYTYLLWRHLHNASKYMNISM